LLQLLVDVRIVDDSPTRNTRRSEIGAGFVAYSTARSTAVAEPELTRELERQVADREDVPVSADTIHHAAVVVRRERSLDVALEAEAASKIVCSPRSI